MIHNSHSNTSPSSGLLSRLDARRPGSQHYPYSCSSRGTVNYSPRSNGDRCTRRAANNSNFNPSGPSLPAPHIEPRQRRPHSIHIVSYPSGFVPYDLRPKTAVRDAERQRKKEEERRQKRQKGEDKKRAKEEERRRKQRELESRRRQHVYDQQQQRPTTSQQDKRRSFGGSLSAANKNKVGTFFHRLKAVFSTSESQRLGGTDSAAVVAQNPRPQARTRVRPVSWLSVTSRLSRADDTLLGGEFVSSATAESCRRPATATLQSQESSSSRPTTSPQDRTSSLSTTIEQSTSLHPAAGSCRTASNFRAAPPREPGSLRTTPPVQTVLPLQEVAMVDVPVRGPNIGVTNPNRNSFMSVRSAKSIVSSSVQEVQFTKPIASGSGLSCTVILAEHNVFLTGFDHDGHTRHESHNSTALLRGKLQISVSRNTKVKAVTLKLLGKARTEWPEGIPPMKMDMYEEESLRTQALTFFHAMHDGWETEYGNQCTYILKGNRSKSNLMRQSLSPGDPLTSLHLGGGRHRSNLSAKELKKLSLRSVESRSFGKDDSSAASQVQAKGFKVFHPGVYEYSFELPIDHHQLETIKLQYGSVKWELETTVERAGTFKPNLHGTKEVSIVRVPDQLSLETSEPISISRRWEDQLHYDIMISGKSFPIGAKIPIAFKLTPLAKVQVHKVKIFVTESIEYWTNDRKVTRKDSGRKILLLEKSAGKPLDKQFEASELRILSGGELSPDERLHAREMATRRRTNEAQRTGSHPQPLPEPTENLLGDLDLGLEMFWGSTEMEMNVQMPTCEMMVKDKSLRLHPDCSWKNVNVHHWMKIVMRISRLDPDDSAGKRRRHFEISIDSPFTVLNCRATQANIALPQYGSPEIPADSSFQTLCGCPDARILNSSGRTHENLSGNLFDISALPTPPRAAHLHAARGGVNTNSISGANSPTRAVAASTTSTSPTLANPLDRVRNQEAVARPIHLIRYPSFDPPPFNAEPPPPTPTPPPNYDIVIGTPSVDGMADYFTRLSYYEDMSQAQGVEAVEASGGGFFAWEATASRSGNAATTPQANRASRSNTSLGSDDDGEDTEVESDSESDGGQRARTVSRTGTVNVPNPRTPGGRLLPSRSFEIERSVVDFTLNVAGVIRRGAVGSG